jgi:hypothetical protein
MKNSAALFFRVKDKVNTRIEKDHMFQRITKQVRHDIIIKNRQLKCCESAYASIHGWGRTAYHIHSPLTVWIRVSIGCRTMCELPSRNRWLSSVLLKKKR